MPAVQAILQRNPCCLIWSKSKFRLKNSIRRSSLPREPLRRICFMGIATLASGCLRAQFLPNNVTQKEVILVTQSVSPMSLSAARLVTQRSPTCHSERSDESENGEKINTEKYPLLPDPKMHHFVLHDNAALNSVLCTLNSVLCTLNPEL